MTDTGVHLVRSLIRGIWTVGWVCPLTGGWVTISEHDHPRDAEQFAELLNGREGRFAYANLEPGLWVVGEVATWTIGDRTNTYWEPISDHTSEAEAAAEVIRLNA